MNSAENNQGTPRNNRMDRRLVEIGCAMLIAVALLVVLWRREFPPTSVPAEDFYDCSFVLSAPQSTYGLGDKVEFTLKIVTQGTKRVHICQPLQGSFHLFPLEGYSPLSLRERQSAMKEVSITSMAPLVVEIEGIVKPSDKIGHVNVDFAGYGSLVVATNSVVGFFVRAAPVRSAVTDSAYWGGSNIVPLTFQDTKGAGP